VSAGHLFPEDGAIAVSTCEFATLDHGTLAALIQADDSSHGPLVFFRGATRRLIRYRFSILHRSACLANGWPLPNSAGFYLDGNLQATVDTYLTPSKANSAIYSLSGLTAGVHTLGITVTGTHSAASDADDFQAAGTQAAAVDPSINANGVVNAASFAPAPNNHVARGQIISIFDQNFIPGGSAGANTTPLPTQLGPQNTSLTACGQAIPLYTVYPTQINAQLPLECPASGSVTAAITVNGQKGTQTFSVAQSCSGSVHG
jgi:hypothetical protein